MDENKILDGNKLIADFMGVVWNENIEQWAYTPTSYFKELYYHNNWNWLMGVVKHIADDEESLIDVPMEQYRPYFEKIKSALSFVEIKLVWKAVIEFIKWYNQNTNKIELRKK